MATCGSLQHIFDSLLPENPTLLESLSRNQIKPVKSIEPSSFTELFGELHFNESPIPSPSSSSTVSTSPTEINNTKLNQNENSESSVISQTPITNHNRHKSSGSFSWLNSESLHLCTEGLGFESSDDVEDSKSGVTEYWTTENEKEDVKEHLSSRDSYGECRKSRVSGVEYPPPISSIGRTGKPWVSFRSYRTNGRFVLKEIRVPTQEFLHAFRENGRLKLQFVHPEDEEEAEEEDDDDDDDIGSMDDDDDDEEENMGKEDCCETDHANDEKAVMVK